MKRLLLIFYFGIFLAACNNEATEPAAESPDPGTSSAKAVLPYSANYTSAWTDDVTDDNLKMVLQTYKDWETGNLDGLANALADTISVDLSSGEHFRVPKAEIMQRWSTYRDSLTSIRISMDAWRKMYASDKKDSYIIVWYDEYDTFKDGRVDSSSFHDINQIKNGKITWYSQYRRPKK